MPSAIRKRRRPPGVKRKSWTAAARRRDPVSAWITRKNARVSVPRNKLGFPTSMEATLRYTEVQEIKPTSLQCLHWVYGANDCFDPLVNLGGHQPRGFNEYSDLYKTYTVTSSKIMVNFMYDGYLGVAVAGADQEINGDPGADVPAASPVICGVFKSAGPDVPVMPTVDRQMEKDRNSYITMTPTEGAKTVRQGSDFVEFFGKQDLVASADYSALVDARPNKKVFYSVWAARGTDRTSGTCTIKAFTTIDYKVTFTEPKALPQS